MHALHVAGEVTVIMLGVCMPVGLLMWAIWLKVERDNVVAAIAVGVLGVLSMIALMTLLELHTERTRLCARGHETYQMVGKTLQRVWVCEDK